MPQEEIALVLPTAIPDLMSPPDSHRPNHTVLDGTRGGLVGRVGLRPDIDGQSQPSRTGKTLRGDPTLQARLKSVDGHLCGQ